MASVHSFSESDFSAPRTPNYIGAGSMVLPQGFLPWEVHKFGGASLADAKLYKTCADLLVREANRKGKDSSPIPTCAVVSAAYGVTDMLIGVVEESCKGTIAKAHTLLDKIIEKLQVIMKELGISAEAMNKVMKNIEQDCVDVRAMLAAIHLMRTIPAPAMELVTGLGEVWSAQMMSMYLKEAGVACDWVDCRRVLFVQGDTNSGLGDKGGQVAFVQPNWERSVASIRSWWMDFCKQNSWINTDSPTTSTPVSGARSSELNFKSDVATKFAPIIVVTGFVASTEAGVPTTLKRSGSDYTATIFAKLLRASKITMWKNVNGVYSADPRRVPDAFPIRSLMYEEAMELAYFGAQVLHPSAMSPCIEGGIEVHVRNIFRPDLRGTVIRGSVYDTNHEDFESEEEGGEGRGKEKEQESSSPAQQVLRRMSSVNKSASIDHLAGKSGLGAVRGRLSIASGVDVIKARDQLPVKGITSIDNVALLNLEDAHLIGVPGVASRMFSALAAAGISVILISQASSEHSTCAVVEEAVAERAADAVRGAFELELMRKTVARVIVHKGLCAVAIVGEGMSYAPGVAGTMFHALASAHINVRAIAQGSSERNITAVIDKCNVTKALRAIHGAFSLSARPVSVAIVGAGRVGRELLIQIHKARKHLVQDLHVDIRLRALADKDKYLVGETSNDGVLSLDQLEALWENAPVPPVDFDVADVVQGSAFPHAVIIDCTASDIVASWHTAWLKRGCHVISANRKCVSGEVQDYMERKASATAAQVTWSYEVCVGGPLPILSSLRDLLDTGDAVHKIEAYISTFWGRVMEMVSPISGGAPKPFSEAVRQAASEGFTDRRLCDDLSCVDMSRKLTILAREIGCMIERKEVVVDTFLPHAVMAILQDCKEVCPPSCLGNCDKCGELMDNLVGYDAEIAQNIAARCGDGLVLRCVGLVDISHVDSAQDIHAVQFRAIKATTCQAQECHDNNMIVSVFTARYSPNPLTLIGPGSGAERVAQGVFADLLRVARSLR